ncbi:MAG: NAD(P)-dependent alcohol dehydrogenase [Bacteroidota bacterium]
MKAIVWTKYGSPDGLQLREVEKPSPRDNEVLIRVHATSVSAADSEMRTMNFPFWLWLPIRLMIGLRRPRRITILGQELAGVIEATGRNVTRFQPGDPVFAWTGLHFGGYAGYDCLPETAMMMVKPASLSYEEAAAIPVGGLEAWCFLRKAKVRPGEKVLVYGAGGSIGTFAVQLARYYGAEVTAVDRASKHEMLRALGASHVIDHTREDFTRSGQAYDVIIDAIAKAPFAGSIRSLTPQGRYLSNPRPSKSLQGKWLTRDSRKQVLLETAGQTIEDLQSLCALLESGRIKAVIDRTYPLEQAAEAHRYVDGGEKKGNVILTVTHPSDG